MPNADCYEGRALNASNRPTRLWSERRPGKKLHDIGPINYLALAAKRTAVDAAGRGGKVSTAAIGPHAARLADWAPCPAARR